MSKLRRSRPEAPPTPTAPPVPSAWAHAHLRATGADREFAPIIPFCRKARQNPRHLSPACGNAPPHAAGAQRHAPAHQLFARPRQHPFAGIRYSTGGIGSGILFFRARVAEWQTRRSQKPLSHDVRVRLSPRAPLFPSIYFPVRRQCASSPEHGFLGSSATQQLRTCGFASRRFARHRFAASLQTPPLANAISPPASHARLLAPTTTQPSGPSPSQIFPTGFARTMHASSRHFRPTRPASQHILPSAASR